VHGHAEWHVRSALDSNAGPAALGAHASGRGMTSDAVILFLSLLALFVQVGLAVTLAVLVVPAGANARRRLLDLLGTSAEVPASAIAVVAMVGSLYLSEGAHFLPCALCWYQRIAMYSLAVLLTVAVVRRRTDVGVYAIPLATIGAAISSYHILVERFPRLESGVCKSTTPCTVIWTRRLGYLTIPTMALTAFVAIITLLALGSYARLDRIDVEEI
jgi:disulfide bond formation protein DsbB